MATTASGTTGISCNNGVDVTWSNSWWRRFYFNEHPQVGAKALVKSVTITAGRYSIPGGLPSTIRLYTIAHSQPVDTIPTHALTLIGSATANVAGAWASVTIPVTGFIDDTVSKDLVVEWYTPGTALGVFYPGGNSTPETHPTFVSSTDCGYYSPVAAASMGYPSFHLPMVVTLETGATVGP